mmetsp:Transcript_31256/g.85860  ORF Transcript_31256/g.85860 Transcript_31256/m.85860 type:complete len:201 (-) Transcript_31256:91-693(-)|eukprot:CAMPEP_0117526176 /NCGR_PEP_ID=MMETSP0784-20121206/36151_1 /TAXON_ID=39447 /ORGANISM="" /LENGTH=200 /DNA_ID=CAMNT_0005322397 /DNA_START=77 /DNA_END=679 /DNA_ORIENTATION=-
MAVPEQVIGKVAKDVVASPRVQAAAHAVAQDALSITARSAVDRGSSEVKAGFLTVGRYVEENHCSVKALSFCAALALLASSMLGMINIFVIVLHPYNYLFLFYNAVFAGAIVIVEGKSTWYERCWDIQSKLFSVAGFLAAKLGRAVFYFYVGSINVAMFRESWLCGITGGMLFLAGVLMLLDRCGFFCKHDHEEEPVARP